MAQSPLLCDFVVELAHPLNLDSHKSILLLVTGKSKIRAKMLAEAAYEAEG